MDIFVFEFYSAFNMEWRKNLSYHVYSKSREDMEVFIRQHRFPEYCLNMIKIVRPEDIDMNEYESLELRRYRFCSNKYPDKPCEVVTAYRFIEEAIEFVGVELGETLMFGNPVLRTEIEIFKIINDLIDQLPHVAILDHTLIDGDTGDIYSKDWQKYLRKYLVPDYNDEVLMDSVNVELIIDSIYRESTMTGQQLQPITLEAYVKSFSFMLVDRYE